MKMLQHKFVEFIPEKVEEGVLYVSIEYCTAIHKCVCGCGNEVVTPISPTDWQLIFDGQTITLHPSIGNWSFKCQSHYWIRNNKVEHSFKWDKWEIDAGRKKDRENKKRYYKNSKTKFKETAKSESQLKKQNIWQLFLRFFKRK